MADFYETEEERRRRAEMQQALAILGSSYQLPDAAPVSTVPPRTEELPPRAAAALAAYQARENDLPTTPDRIRVRDDRPPESVPEDNLGVAGVPAFDSVAEALALTRQAPDEQPLAADTNRALEATGSAYRVPDAPVEQRDAQSNPYPETIGQSEFNPRAGTKQLQRELAQGQNDALDYVTEKGAVQSAGQQRVAAAAGELKAQRAQGLADVQHRIDVNRADQQGFQQQAYERLNKISAMVDNPPDQSKGKVLSIIGAVLSMSEKGGAIGRGLQMLGRSMAGDVDAWSREIQAQRAAMSSSLEMADTEAKDSEHELRMQSSLADLGFGVYDASLRQIQAETAGQEAEVVAGSLRNELRNKYVETRIELNQQEAAARAKFGRDQGQTQEDTVILRALSQVPEEQRAEVAMQYGPRAVEVLKKMQGVVEGQADIEGKRANAEKTAREARNGPPMTDGDKKLQRLAEGVRPAYDTLSKLADRVGKGQADIPYIGIGPGATKMFAGEQTQGVNNDILQLANVLLRDESGASLPPSEQETKWESWGLLSPDQKVRNRGLGKMLAEYEGRVAHVAPVAPAATPAPRQDAPRQEAAITMTSPSGRTVQVPASKAAAAEANGYKRTQPAATAEATRWPGAL